MKKDPKEYVKIFFEMGYLKRLKRSGWFRLGIEQPESIADHSFRTAIIAFYIAMNEGLDPYRASTYALFHDVLETKTGDLNYIQKRYVVPNEEKARNEYKEYFDVIEIPEEYKDIVKDADLLDLILQAIEYKNCGYKTDRFIKGASKKIKTETGKKLLKTLEEVNPQDWWY